jgi:HlyD family secretion protein
MTAILNKKNLSLVKELQMKKHFKIRLGLPLLALVMFIVTVISVLNHPDPGYANPPIPAPTSPFKDSVAGIGIIEPQSEMISAGTNITGIITHINVVAGQQVKIGDPLFKIGNKNITAELKLAKARLESSKIELASARQQLSYDEDKDQKNDEVLIQQRYATQLAQQKVQEAEDAIGIITTQIEQTTINSPINGTVLSVNIHTGESVQNDGAVAPLILLGNISAMHVRAEVDETDAFRITPSSQATGMLRGHPSQLIPLKFVREEPIITPKKSLGNEANEIVDTRVLQIIYAFDNSKLNAHVGQRMDVFIAAKPLSLSLLKKTHLN